MRTWPSVSWALSHLQSHDSRPGRGGRRRLAARIAVLAQIGLESDADDFGGLMAARRRAVRLPVAPAHFGFAAQNTHYSQDGWNEDVPGVIGIYRNQRRRHARRPARRSGRRLGVRACASGRRRHLEPSPSRYHGDRADRRRRRRRHARGTRARHHLRACGRERRAAVRLEGHRYPARRLAAVHRRQLPRPAARAADRGHCCPRKGCRCRHAGASTRSSDHDVDGAYFNPDEYRNWDAGLSLRRHVGGWTVSGLAGAGRERVDDASWQTTGIAELRAEGPLAGKARITVDLLYNRAAGFAPPTTTGTARPTST